MFQQKQMFYKHKKGGKMETKDRYIKTRRVYTIKEQEKKIEAKFRDRIKELGGKAYKFVSPR